MSLLKVEDNFQATIVGNYSTSASTITLSNVPALVTAGYLTVFDFDGNQFEKIKFGGVSGTDITSVLRGLSFTTNSDTEIPANKKELKNGMVVKLSVTQHYLNPVIDFVNQYDGKWMGAVANFAALPQPASDGEVRVTLDDSKIYVYDLDTTTWNLAGAGGGAGTVYITTKLGTEAEGDDNKTFELNSGSFPDKKYLQVYKNGVLQEEGASNDYVAAGSNQAVFNDVVLDTDKITLLVISVDIYNPAWNNVNGDILPDLDAAHDIGSSSKQFKDGYFSGKIYGDGSELTDVKIEYFGDGSDGDVIISTNTSLARDMFYNNLTINNSVTLNPNGYRIFVKNTLTNNGTIARVGNNGGNGGNASSGTNGTAGSAGAALASGTIYGGLAGKAGATGDNISGTNGDNLSPSITGVNGVAGGGGGGNTNGGTGGTATIESSIFDVFNPSLITLNAENNAYNLFVLRGITSLGTLSTSAGSGSGGTGNVSGSDKAGGGGGSGGNGGIVYITAKTIINNGVISVAGGNGGNGGNGYQGDSGQTAAGGGGGGGQGGLIILVYKTLSVEGTLTVSGGTKGLKGTGTGQDGTDGNAGKYIKIKIN